MKYRKLLISILIFLSIFIIYILNADKRINYIALGDSLAAGQNPYGQINYGYTDYVANYLERNKLLKFYTKGFSASGDRIDDLLQDIKNNATIQIDDKVINIKASLRESDLVTISIGANDFIKDFNLKTIDTDIASQNLIKKVDNIIPKLDEVLKEVRKYATKEVIVIGYYNPLPRMTTPYQETIDKLFNYADNNYQNICNKHKVTYIKIYDLFKGHNDYLPNPFDIHPNSKGYELISNEIIDYLEKKVLN